MKSSYLEKHLALLGLALVAMTQLVAAQPVTPRVLINDAYRLVQLRRGQRTTVRYDLRPIRGEHLKIDLYKHSQLEGEAPLREWVIHKSHGTERISFEDLPRSVYRLIAYACDEQGQPLAVRAPLIHVNYGGWRAWEDFKPAKEVVKEPPPTFEAVGVSTNVANIDAAIYIVPQAVVLKPGESTVFQSGYRNVDKVALNWSLKGQGELTKIDDFSYSYKAPADQLGTKLFRLEVTSPSHPNLQGGATILVSSADNSQPGE